ncbi:MAG: insulinase family protein, partial [Coprococcus sp.]
IIKNMDAARRDDILDVIRSELKKLADGGLNHKTMEGALNFYEFKSREGDFGRWPKGLLYGMQLMDSWLYDDSKPFIHLKFQQVFDSLREDLEKGYFEQLIRTYMIDNTHGSVYLLCPSRGLAARKEKALADKLAAYKASLSEEEVEKLVEDTAQLKLYQSEPSPKEVLEMIPLLSIDDIKKEAEPLYNEEKNFDGVHVLHHDIETNEIGYVNMLFDLGHVKEEDVPYLGILTEAFGNMNTDHYSYQELTDEVNLHTGGLRSTVSVYGVEDKDTYRPVFEMGGKALYNKMPKMFKLLEEILLHTHFEDEKRLKEILNQLKSRLEMNFLSNGHTVAVNRATSYFSQGTWFKELTEGIAFYQFICDTLKDYETKKTEVIGKLQSLCSKIFRKEYLLADVTANEEGLELCRKEIERFGSSLNTESMSEEERRRISVGVCPTHNEAFITAGMIQYNACAANFGEKGIAYNGSMNVIKNILSNEYLWNNIRVKGGAYGCMCGFAPSGNAYFTSYRDPNLEETYAVYDGAADFVASLELDNRELTKYIIGAVGAIDTPMTASMKGVRSLAAWLGHRSYEQIQKTRDELLGTTVEDLRNQAAAVAAVAAAGHICVVGSESRIMAQKEKFEHVTQLLK